MYVQDIPQSDPVIILLNKIDVETNTNTPQSNAKLENAEFTVKYFSGLYGDNPEEHGIVPVRQWVLRTDKDGFTALDDEYKISGDDFYYSSMGDVTLPLGTITIEETKAPEGYLINPEVFIRQINSNDSAVEDVNTYNAPTVPETVQKGTVELFKADEESGNMLANAVYGIYFNDDAEVGRLITDKNGYAKSDLLPYGNYYIQEITTPNGYVIDKTKHPFSISADGVTVAVNLTDKLQKGIISITKTDEESGNTLPNAIFEIFAKTDIITADGVIKHKAGDLVDTITSGNNGIATTKKLYLGNYTVKEKQAPDGYIVNTTPYDVTLTYAGQNATISTAEQTITNKNQMGQIKGTKTGEVLTGSDFRLTEVGMMYAPIYEVQCLPNATYEIFAKEDIKTPEGTLKYKKGELADTVTTDAQGKFTSKKLYLGTYTVKEKTAPDGYVLDKNEYDVTLSYAGQDKDIVLSFISLSDERQKVIISLKKEMEDHTIYPNPEAYKDVRFGLYAADIVQDVNGDIALEKDNLLEVITLDETLTGTVTIDIPLGNYYLQEIATNEAYILDDTKYPVDFEYQGQEIALVEIVANKGNAIPNPLIRGQVELYKKSEFPQDALLQGFANIPLANAVYGIYDIEGNERAQLKIDELGHAKSELLPYGKYYLKEISPPFGYHINEQEYPFQIKEEGEVITIDVTDEPKIGVITAKYNEHGGADGLSNMENVKTGDSSNFALYFIVSLLVESMIVLVVIVILRKIKINQKGVIDWRN